MWLSKRLGRLAQILSVRTPPAVPTTAEVVRLAELQDFASDLTARFVSPAIESSISAGYDRLRGDGRMQIRHEVAETLIDLYLHNRHRQKNGFALSTGAAVLLQQIEEKAEGWAEPVPIRYSMSMNAEEYYDGVFRSRWDRWPSYGRLLHVIPTTPVYRHVFLDEAIDAVLTLAGWSKQPGGWYASTENESRAAEPERNRFVDWSKVDLTSWWATAGQDFKCG